jgi:uncharacterized membrane protein YeaQ/YmgE (transglycosylase-associated protein family)
MEAWGAIFFGMVVGWTTYRTLRRKTAQPVLSDLVSVIGAIGGGAITKLFPAGDGGSFAAYSVGLAVGFFGYVIIARLVEGTPTDSWLMKEY